MASEVIDSLRRKALEAYDRIHPSPRARLRLELLRSGRFAPTSFPPFPQSLRGDTQGAVELARRVLPGDRRRKFDHRVLAKVAMHLLEEVVVDVAVREGDSVGVLWGWPARRNLRAAQLSKS